MGLGKCLPKKRVTNQSLAKKLKTDPDSIVGRTGIRCRHFAGKKESASFLSAQAAKQALKNAGVTPQEIQLIIGATSSGDYLFPAMACKVQCLIGASKAAAFDLSASAAGFLVGISLAADGLRYDLAMKNALVIGTAVQSPYIDWKTPALAVLLGDGSGAALVSRVPEGYGILASKIISDGRNFEAARLRGGNSRHIEMDGVVMGREFLKNQPVVIEAALKKADLKLKDVDLFIFHQANARLIQFLMGRLGVPISKTHMNIERVGNTAEASLPMALYDAQEAGRLKRGQIVVLSAIGAGTISAATVLRWY